MPSPYSYTVIRQNYQNSNLSTRGLNLAAILGNPRNNVAMYNILLGSGTQANRIYNFNKTHPRDAALSANTY